jgi:CRP-like cAMP-binding protein
VKNREGLQFLMPDGRAGDGTLAVRGRFWAMKNFQNKLLTSLPRVEHESVSAAFEKVELARYEVLYEPDARITHVYFPDTAVISQIVALPEGTNVEGAMIGSEGVVGAGGALTNRHSFTRQMIQAGGTAHRVSSQRFVAIYESCPDLRMRILTYGDVFTAHLMQAIACNVNHDATERFARFLLELHNRGKSTELGLTHEYMAMLIGVSRPTLTMLMRSFEAAQLVRGRRGGVLILDTSGLQEIACSCYQLIQRAYAHSDPPFD